MYVFASVPLWLRLPVRGPGVGGNAAHQQVGERWRVINVYYKAL